jgi:hypothetical protein
MPQQVDQRELADAVVLEPEHHAFVVCRVLKLAQPVFEGAELPCVFQRWVEILAVGVDNEACPLLEIPRPLAYRTLQVGIDIHVPIAAEAGLLGRIDQIMTAADMQRSKFAVEH